MRRLTLRRRVEALEAARADRRPDRPLTEDEQLTEDAKRIQRFLRLKAEERGVVDYVPPSLEELRARLIETRRRYEEGSQA